MTGSDAVAWLMRDSFIAITRRRVVLFGSVPPSRIAPWHSRDDIVRRHVWIMFDVFCERLTTFAWETCGWHEAMSIVALWGPMPIWTPVTFRRPICFSVVNARCSEEISIQVRWATRLSLPVERFFFPRRTWSSLVSYVEGCLGPGTTGSKPCHLNALVNISTVNLNQNAALNLFFSYTHFNPPISSSQAAARCRLPRSLSDFFHQYWSFIPPSGSKKKHTTPVPIKNF